MTNNMTTTSTKQTYTIRIGGRVRVFCYTRRAYARQGSDHDGPYQTRYQACRAFLRPRGGILLVWERCSQWQGEPTTYRAHLFADAAAASDWARCQPLDLAIDALRDLGVYCAPEVE